MPTLTYDSPFHVTYDAKKASKMALKVDFAIMLTRSIKEHGWTQAMAAEKLGISQSRVSDLATLKTENFTIDAMMDLLDKLGYAATMSLDSLDEALISITKNKLACA